MVQVTCIINRYQVTLRIMILGFLGKGGSGKSSVATQTALFTQQEGKMVLAIDADHNMDLSYNLTAGLTSDMRYFSHSLNDLQAAVGLSGGQKYSEVFLQEIPYRFTLDPLAPQIAKYSTLPGNGIRLMTAGPQTDEVLYGQKCSHSLATPLKILLPLLKLNQNEIVVVDEKAGADGVSTGIVTGIDVGIIVCEPSLHSVKAAKQIAKLMDFYNTPYVFVGNKITSSEDKDFVTQELGREPVVFLMESNSVKRNPSMAVDEWKLDLQDILHEAANITQDNRLERTVAKFQRNQEFTRA